MRCCERSVTHLGSEALGEDLVGKTGDVGLSLLDDDKGKSADVGSDNASTNGLALALSVLAGAVARVALSEEELDTVGNEDTLLEGESLLLLTANRGNWGVRAEGARERSKDEGWCEMDKNRDEVMRSVLCSEVRWMTRCIGGTAERRLR